MARAGCGLVLVSSQPPSPPGATLGTAAPPRRSYLSAVHWSHHPHHAAASSNHSASSRCRYSVSGAHSQEGGHRCLLCPLYSAEPLYCTVQLPGLVAVVQVASPPARQPRYCIIIMVGAAPAPAPAPAAAPAVGNPGVVLWCCPAATTTATTTATPPTTPPQRNDWEQDIFLQAADTPAYQHYSITTNQPRYMDYRQHCADWLCNIVLTEQIKICVLKRGELLQRYCVFILTSYHFNYGCVMSEIKHSYSINVTTAECAA